MQFALDRLRIARLAVLPRRFGEWWLGEFLNLLPERIVEFLSGRGRTSLVVVTGEGHVTLEQLSSTRVPIASERLASSDNALAEIDRFLRSRGLERKDVDIGLRLPAESVFCRQLRLPVEAVNAIDVIVAQDLAKKTPFKPEDIYCDHAAPERVDGNKIAVWQWITRRQYVHQALLPLKIDVAHLAFVVFDRSGEGQPAPFINLQPSAQSGNSWRQRAAVGLCCSAVFFALVAGGLKYWNQQTAIDRLDAQIAAISSKAQQVRALVDQLQEKKNALLRLRLQRSEKPGLIDLWEETTRVLPSHSWLIEFRLAETVGKREDQVSITGFSNAAPSLVGIIDSSPLFFDAALTSPIAFDATEGRERFALQAKVRAPDAFKETAAR
ncbi:MAG TPA: PilN domain-containing protein [Bradyrhizobium sp.]|nr:PilN domain-containing protein [Bradyrhizobium sp.]